MNNELKQKIDAIWLYSDFGKWCKAIASNDSKTADSLCKQIFDSGYPEMEILEDELANNIAKLMKSESDIAEYLQLVEKILYRNMKARSNSKEIRDIIRILKGME